MSGPHFSRWSPQVGSCPHHICKWHHGIPHLQLTGTWPSDQQKGIFLIHAGIPKKTESMVGLTIPKKRNRRNKLGKLSNRSHAVSWSKTEILLFRQLWWNYPHDWRAGRSDWLPKLDVLILQMTELACPERMHFWTIPFFLAALLVEWFLVSKTTATTTNNNNNQQQQQQQQNHMFISRQVHIFVGCFLQHLEKKQLFRHSYPWWHAWNLACGSKARCLTSSFHVLGIFWGQTCRKP